MTRADAITAERLRELLHYDPETGVFTRLCGRCAGRRAGALNETGYRHVYADGVLYLEHILAWLYMTGEWPDDEVDHWDLDKSNNRWGNLRQATSSQNQMNHPIKKTNTSGHKGVHWAPHAGKWRAQIRISGVGHHLGYFATAEEASAAYAQAAKLRHGAFARVR